MNHDLSQPILLEKTPETQATAASTSKQQRKRPKTKPDSQEQLDSNGKRSVSRKRSLTAEQRERLHEMFQQVQRSRPTRIQAGP